MSTSQPLRAAIYVRMSTENQNYSTDHQRAKIHEYALGKRIEIVREYVDEGKSGLDIRRRTSAQSHFSHVRLKIDHLDTYLFEIDAGRQLRRRWELPAFTWG